MSETGSVAEVVKVLKWAWQGGVLYADEFDSLENAVLAAAYASDDAAEALECVEVLNDDGTTTVHGRNAVWDLGEQLRPPTPVESLEDSPRFVVTVKSPQSGDWAQYHWHKEEADAQAEAAELERLLPGRVRVDEPRKNWPTRAHT